MVKSTNHAALRYAVFSTLLSLYPFLVQMLSSATCSHTPLGYVPPLILETKFHIDTETTSKIIVLYILILKFFDSR
jgi:hypothetical protein